MMASDDAAEALMGQEVDRLEIAHADQWIFAEAWPPPRDRDIDVWVVKNGAFAGACRYADAHWDRERSAWVHDDRGCCNPIQGTVTYWMPIPAAPRNVFPRNGS